MESIQLGDAFLVRCRHGKDVYTLNCHLNQVPDNKTLTPIFPSKLKPLIPHMEQISLTSSNITALPSDLFTLFTDVELLTAYAGLKNLTQKNFQNANKLTQLKLGLNNHIGYLESSLFAKVPTLKYIDLAYNDIADMGDNVFGGLSELQYLYLEGNSIEKLKNNVFAGAVKLHMLELSRNELRTIEDDAFAGLDNLKVLMLNRNYLTVLQAPVFRGIPHLERIDMSLNQVAEIEDGVFDGMGHLQLLEMGFNNLSVLPDGVFNGLKKLDKLYLGYNRLEDVSEAFLNLSTLKILDLTSNQLGNFNGSLVSNKTKLDHLELRLIGLTELPMEMLEQQTELQLLDLSFNNLSLNGLQFDRAFRKLHRLEVLKLENTSTSSISDEMHKYMPRLKFINLASNNMDCEGVHGMVGYFSRFGIEYEFGEEIDVSCTLIPYASPALQAYDLSNSEFLHIKQVNILLSTCISILF